MFVKLCRVCIENTKDIQKCRTKHLVRIKLREAGIIRSLRVFEVDVVFELGLAGRAEEALATNLADDRHVFLVGPELTIRGSRVLQLLQILRPRAVALVPSRHPDLKTRPGFFIYLKKIFI